MRRLERLPDVCDGALVAGKPQLDWSECEYAELGEGRSISRPFAADVPLEYDDNGVKAVLDECGGSSEGVNG